MGQISLLHLHNVPSDIQPSEISALLPQFQISQIKIKSPQRLALLHFTSKEEAMRAHDHCQNINLTIRDEKIGLSFSTYTPQPDPASNHILFTTIHNPPNPINVHTVHEAFSPFGFVEKIRMFKKKALHAFIQYTSSHEASNALTSLNGKKIWVGSTVLIRFANNEEVIVDRNSSWAFDFGKEKKSVEVLSKKEREKFNVLRIVSDQNSSKVNQILTSSNAIGLYLDQNDGFVIYGSVADAESACEELNNEEFSENPLTFVNPLSLQLTNQSRYFPNSNIPQVTLKAVNLSNFGDFLPSNTHSLIKIVDEKTFLISFSSSQFNSVIYLISVDSEILPENLKQYLGGNNSNNVKFLFNSSLVKKSFNHKFSIQVTNSIDIVLVPKVENEKLVVANISFFSLSSSKIDLINQYLIGFSSYQSFVKSKVFNSLLSPEDSSFLTCILSPGAQFKLNNQIVCYLNTLLSPFLTDFSISCTNRCLPFCSFNCQPISLNCNCFHCNENLSFPQHLHLHLDCFSAGFAEFKQKIGSFAGNFIYILINNSNFQNIYSKLINSSFFSYDYSLYYEILSITTNIPFINISSSSNRPQVELSDTLSNLAKLSNCLLGSVDSVQLPSEIVQNLSNTVTLLKKHVPEAQNVTSCSQKPFQSSLNLGPLNLLNSGLCGIQQSTFRCDTDSEEEKLTSSLDFNSFGCESD
ncbi:hypothetical protein P9112_012961 [Eukaryota sp. TZLM1-RC]